MNREKYMKENIFFFNIDEHFNNIINKYVDEFEQLIDSGASKIKIFFPSETSDNFDYECDAACINKSYEIGCHQIFNDFENSKTFCNDNFHNKDFFDFCKKYNIPSLEHLILIIDIKERKLSINLKKCSIKVKKAAVILFDIIFSKIKNKRFLELSENNKIKKLIDYKTHDYINSLIVIKKTKDSFEHATFNVLFFINSNVFSKSLDVTLNIRDYIFDLSNFKKITLNIDNGDLKTIKMSKNHNEENIDNYKLIIKSVLGEVDKHYNQLDSNKKTW